MGKTLLFLLYQKNQKHPKLKAPRGGPKSFLPGSEYDGF